MLYLLLAAALCGVDQLFKLWVVHTIPLDGRIELIPGVLELTHIRNTGMAFSLFGNHTWVLAVVSGLVSLVLAILLLKGKFTGPEKTFLAMVLGGAVGNFIDRAFLGYVVDMINPVFVRFAIFNLADTFIDVGAVLFCVFYIVRTTREERKKRRGEGEELESDADGQ